MDRKISRISLAMICVFALLLCMISMSIPASADEIGSLTVISKSDDKPLEGVDWNIYRIGSGASDGSFVLEGDFADCPVSLNGLDASNAQDAANTLEVYAKTGSCQPAASGTSDAEGTAVFSELTSGIYLVSGEPVTINGYIYTPVAAIVEFSGEDMEIYGKFSIKESPVVPIVTLYKVSKIWQNDENKSVRPSEITVELYKSNELADTVVLSEENNWTYEWEGLESDVWTVVEKEVPQNYTVTYRDDGAEFAVINTYTDNEDESSVSDSSEISTGTGNNSKIPQTGLLWWPVPLLACAGLVFIAVGARVKRK